jgi:hypothetical protein
MTKPVATLFAIALLAAAVSGCDSGASLEPNRTGRDKE